MDFGSSQKSENKNNTYSQRLEVKAIVEKMLNSDNIDQKKLYQAVVGNLGEENVDSQMLNFAIKQSTEKIQALRKSGKHDLVNFNRAVDLVVDWALIKIKSKSTDIANSSDKETEIGSNQPDQSIIDSLL